MSLPNFANQAPRTPEEEGYIKGLTTVVEEYNMHFDGEDHTSYNIPTDGIDPDLYERDDFAEGFMRGQALRSELGRMGFAISRHESLEELVAYSHGGTD